MNRNLRLDISMTRSTGIYSQKKLTSALLTHRCAMMNSVGRVLLPANMHVQS